MSERVAVIGAGMAGLFVALALAPTGREITLYERDPPPPDDIEAAFDDWARRGVGQLRHSHGFLARLQGLLRAEHPELLAELFAAGAHEVRFADAVPEASKARYRPEPGDAAMNAFVSRRTTIELVMRRHVERLANVSIESDVFVRRPMIELPAANLVATGLTLEDDRGERQVTADIVVDGGGRASSTIDALIEAGAAPREESEPCQILYYTRFYRRHEGQDEPPRGPHGATGDLGYLKFGVFRADHRTFSVTLAAPEVEETLRTALVRPEVFEAVCQRLPGVAPWTDPARSAPITRVLGMGDLASRWREFAPDGKALVLGYFPVGDALVRTNPLYGRGCTFAGVEAHLLRDVLAETDDPARRLPLYSERVRAALRPFYDDMARQDRGAARRALAGLEPQPPRSWRGSLAMSFALGGIGVAVRAEPDLMRQALRAFHMLDPPNAWVRRPATLAKAAGYWLRGPTANAAWRILQPGPDRAEMFDKLGLPLGADLERLQKAPA